MKPSDRILFTSYGDWLAVKDYGHDDPGRMPTDHLLYQEPGKEIPVAPQRTPVSFSLFDTDEQRARQSRIAANLILEKYGVC
jgi:hypothetical protein